MTRHTAPTLTQIWPRAPSVRYQITPTSRGRRARAERDQTTARPQDPGSASDLWDLMASTYSIQPRLA